MAPVGGPDVRDGDTTSDPPVSTRTYLESGRSVNVEARVAAVESDRGVGAHIHAGIHGVGSFNRALVTGEARSPEL